MPFFIPTNIEKVANEFPPNPDEIYTSCIEFITQPDNMASTGWHGASPLGNIIIEHTDQVKSTVIDKIDSLINLLTKHIDKANLENANLVADKFGDTVNILVGKLGEYMGMHNLTTPALILGAVFFFFKCLKKS